MKRGLHIIGVAGTNGSGKDTIGHLLAAHHMYWFISVTEVLRDECRKRGLPVEREHLRDISAEWRREYGYGVLVDKAIDAFNALPDKKQYRGVVMASLRNPHEADRVHELDGTVLWADADPEVRYKRIQANAVYRGRAGEDAKTYEQFLAEEAAEMHAPKGADEATLDMASVKERSDAFVRNNSSDMDEFEADLLAALGLKRV
ncbi:MAG TPA: AAA family ATPase [Candidatus Saccharimonadales bacterium]|nr:AAA family ATPase [Candidatus Saccharimonadales bacterium]